MPGAACSASALINDGETFDLFSASVDVSYAVDAFGGLRRGLEAAGAVEENTRFELEATYLSLISNVIITAIRQASLGAQIAGAAGHHRGPEPSSSTC